MENKINANGLAIFTALKENEGKALAFAEIANIAGIEAKTGYLTAAKKIAKDNGFAIRKIENGAKARVITVTEYANGLRIEKAKDIELDAYTLDKAE